MNDQWFYGEAGQQHGPISLDALRARVAAGQTRGDDLVWRDGLPAWTPASSVPELAATFRPDAQSLPASAVPPMPGAGYSPSPGYQPATGYPPMPQQYGYDPNVSRLSGSATTAMWFGIVSIVGAFCCAPIGIGFGVAAIIKGRNARAAPNAGAAQAGVVCGWIGVVLSVLVIIANVAMVPAILRDIERQQQRQTQLSP